MPRNFSDCKTRLRFWRSGSRTRPYGPATLCVALSLAGLALAGPSRAQRIHKQPDPRIQGNPLPAATLGSTQVLTYHNDNQRTGVNPYENVLTPAVVKQGFGKLFQRTVDGTIYGQPLFVSNLTITNPYSHQSALHKGVVFVTTANNSIYAYDADSNTGPNAGPLWHDNFNYVQQNITPVPGDAIVDISGTPQADIQPVIGIIGTPIIDPTTSTLYVLVRTEELGYFVHRLHAIDITTGLEQIGSPADVYSDFTSTYPSVPGTGDGVNLAGDVVFDPLFQNQRAALLLSRGIVYISYGPFDGSNDGVNEGTLYTPSYHGWILGYNAGSLQLTSIFNSTPNAAYDYVPTDPPVGGGIDMSGSGPAADDASSARSGDLFVTTGIGLFDATSAAPAFDNDYGESVLNLSPNVTPGSLSVASYFTPFDYLTIPTSFNDLGTGGVVLLPDSVGVAGHPHLLAAAGNTPDGRLYLLDRDNLGGLGYGDDSLTAVYSRTNSVGPVYGVPAYFNGELYYHGAGDWLHAFKLNQTFPFLTDLNPTNTTNLNYDFPGAIPSISSNGTTGGIVWEIQSYSPPISNGLSNTQTGPPISVLRAYDATDTSKAIWSSNDAGGRDTGGPYVKYSVPTVANGKVFVPGDGVLTVYGVSTNPGTASGVHYVISGPGGFGAFDSFVNQFTNLPALTANISYSFNVTAVDNTGKPINLNTTALVYLQDYDLGLGVLPTRIPLTSITFNNSSTTTFTTFFTPDSYTQYFTGDPYFQLTVADSNGNSSFIDIAVAGQTTTGFDHYVLRAPSVVRSGQVTTILVTGQDINYRPTQLPLDTVAVYDTLPAGTQPYDADVFGTFVSNAAFGTFGTLPDDRDGFLTNGFLPAATSTVGLNYEFQWGFGDFDLGPTSINGSGLGYNINGGLAASIPVRFFGVGKHIVVVTDGGFLSNNFISWEFGFTATAIVNVIP